MEKFPSAKEIIKEAKKDNSKADINQLHSLTFSLMLKYKKIYYQDKVKDFLSRPSIINLPLKIKQEIEKELLEPIKGGDVLYSNFMEEAAH